ncbi:MAG TPA: hypothetical protein VJ885_14520 [Thermoanaerobaculia bacterium]|jgi:hypothetical protein|nr:hypothetical protein [Thermoanaerobaculia bacterium]
MDSVIQPVWLRLGEIDCKVEEPPRPLSLALAGLLNGCGRYFDLDASADEELDVLGELRVLLYWFMLESFRDAVFEKPEDLNEPDEIYKIWKTVARVCLTALDQPAIQCWGAEDLSFGHFIEKYSVPIP